MSAAIPYAGDVAASHDFATDFSVFAALTSGEPVLMRVVVVSQPSKFALYTGRENYRGGRWLETSLF